MYWAAQNHAWGHASPASAPGFGDWLEAGHQLYAEHVVASPADIRCSEPLVTHFEQLPAIRAEAGGEFVGLAVGRESLIGALNQVHEVIVALPAGAQCEIGARVQNRLHLSIRKRRRG